MDPDLVTLAQARIWLREHLDEGTYCPCCGQWAKIYRWSLYGTAARLLMRFYRAGGTGAFVESKAVKGISQGSASHLAFWQLVEHEPDRRPDGGKSGWWRVTTQGEAFLQGRLLIPKYAYVYDGNVLRHDGDPTSVYNVLGEQFDWREHMEG
jgi:hypothetical protein